MDKQSEAITLFQGDYQLGDVGANKICLNSVSYSVASAIVEISIKQTLQPEENQERKIELRIDDFRNLLGQSLRRIRDLLGQLRHSLPLVCFIEMDFENDKIRKEILRLRGDQDWSRGDFILELRDSSNTMQSSEWLGTLVPTGFKPLRPLTAIECSKRILMSMEQENLEPWENELYLAMAREIEGLQENAIADGREIIMDKANTESRQAAEQSDDMENNNEQ